MTGSNLLTVNSMPKHQQPYLWVEFEKTGKMRYLSHLEIARVFDRAVRRALIPVAYTKGYHPRAKISFAPPLPVGAEGLRELCEIDLASEMSPHDLGKALSRQLPPGLNLVSAQVLARGRRSPFADLSQAEYNVSVELGDATIASLQNAVATFNEAEQIVIQRETKTRVGQIDIKPNTSNLELKSEDNGVQIYMNLGFGQENLVKPQEVIGALEQIMNQGEIRISRLMRLGMYKAGEKYR